MSFDGLEIDVPRCPLCHSTHVTAISTRTLIFAGIGAGVGFALMAFLMLGSSRDDDHTDGTCASPIVAGMLSGAMAGFSFGNPARNNADGNGYLCLDCFHYFHRFDIGSD
jgi:hypothetical protein